MSEDDRRPPPPWFRPLVEIGPLLAFFVANARGGILVATGVFMVAITAALGASWVVERRLPKMTVVTAVFVLVFGGLTLYLDDELFIKLKPTIVKTLFAAILLGGLAFDRPLLRPLLDSTLRLTDEGWRALTLRWGLFFLFLAALNEVVRRSLSTDAWMTFTVFGNLALSLGFIVSQTGLIKRHLIEEENA